MLRITLGVGLALGATPSDYQPAKGGVERCVTYALLPNGSARMATLWGGPPKMKLQN